ncbi:MAG: hypothetical protein VB118_04805 [Oscillospiraceae bacterium]|nr:hypothetical protein [Oscillospiraceae bacterium]
MTYYELKRNVLLRMGEGANVTASGINSTSVIENYNKAIPMLASEGLAMCAATAIYIVKSYDAVKILSENDIRYDMRALVSDFYSFSKDGITLDNEPYNDYRTEADKIIIIPGDVSGTIKIYYNAYTTRLADNIADGTALTIDPEIYAIIPMYIEGRLRIMYDYGNNSDYGLSLVNEFEQRRAELIAERNKNSPRLSVVIPKGRLRI